MVIIGKNGNSLKNMKFVEQIKNTHRVLFVDHYSPLNLMTMHCTSIQKRLKNARDLNNALP